MPLGRTLAILLAVIVVVAGYIALAVSLGITEYWVGFLFLLVWTMVEGGKLDKLTNVIVGAAAGMAVAFSGIWAAPFLGTAAGLVQLVASLVAVFLLIRQAVGLVVNVAMMLFLTVMTIPHISAASSPTALYLGLAGGVVFFGGLGLAASALSRARASSASSQVSAAT